MGSAAMRSFENRNRVRTSDLAIIIVVSFSVQPLCNLFCQAASISVKFGGCMIARFYAGFCVLSIFIKGKQAKRPVVTLWLRTRGSGVRVSPGAHLLL